MEDKQMTIFGEEVSCVICNGSGIVYVEMDNPRRGRKKINDNGEVYYEDLTIKQSKICPHCK